MTTLHDKKAPANVNSSTPGRRLTTFWHVFIAGSFALLHQICWADSPPPKDRADWTLMVYMAADNNLEAEALTDLDEIEAGMPEQGVEIIVLIDRAKGHSTDLGDWTDARVLRMRPHRPRGELGSKELLRLGEINTGDPDQVSNFI